MTCGWTGKVLGASEKEGAVEDVRLVVVDVEEYSTPPRSVLGVLLSRCVAPVDCIVVAFPSCDCSRICISKSCCCDCAGLGNALVVVRRVMTVRTSSSPRGALDCMSTAPAIPSFSPIAASIVVTSNATSLMSPEFAYVEPRRVAFDISPAFVIGSVPPALYFIQSAESLVSPMKSSLPTRS